MRIRPCEFAEAKAFVVAHHRHHRAPQGHRFSLKAVDADERTIGVCIIGRPVARHQDDGVTLEITRLCTDGTRNACSFLIGAAKRAGQALGYRRLISYTLDTEPGASWKGAGMEQVGETKGSKWKYAGAEAMNPLFSDDTRNNDHPLTDKRVWEIRL